MWQLTHGLLAVLLLTLASLHILAVGRYAHLPAVRLVWFVYFLIFVGVLLRYRVLKPLQLWGKPWEVVENKAELGNAHTLRLRPVDHGGFNFEPGQFGWINAGRTPFNLEQHPWIASLPTAPRATPWAATTHCPPRTASSAPPPARPAIGRPWR